VKLFARTQRFCSSSVLRSKLEVQQASKLMSKTRLVLLVALLLLAAPAWGQNKQPTAPPAREQRTACSTPPHKNYKLTLCVRLPAIETARALLFPRTPAPADHHFTSGLKAQMFDLQELTARSRPKPHPKVAS
jgi:hypothetical protein